MTEYFIHDGTNQQGPFTLDQLKSKNLRLETPIWHEGLTNWTTIGNLPELKNKLLNTTPPPFNSSNQTSSQATYNSTSYETAMSEYFPEKKRSRLIPILIFLGVVAIGIIIWLITKNNQDGDTIKDLEEKVSDERSKNEEKARVEQQKEDEKKRINDEVTQKNMTYRNNWEDYIKLSNGIPKINDDWGGIGEFPVTITNKTDYVIDQVDVFVNYIRRNGTSWQTKTISFLNVPPNSPETKIAPSSVNGVTLEVTIQKIICKKMHFCYPLDNGNPKDPFFCK
jgi:nitrogen fixation-related uncharacterized protein